MKEKSGQILVFMALVLNFLSLLVPTLLHNASVFIAYSHLAVPSCFTPATLVAFNSKSLAPSSWLPPVSFPGGGSTSHGYLS